MQTEKPFRESLKKWEGNNIGLNRSLEYILIELIAYSTSTLVNFKYFDKLRRLIWVMYQHLKYIQM
jgi:hypothetical protein